MGMNMQVLTPELAMRAVALGSNPYRPPEIINLQEEIAGEMRAVDLAYSIIGEVSQDRIEKITAMRLQLDGLYLAWINGEIL